MLSLSQPSVSSPNYEEPPSHFQIFLSLRICLQIRRAGPRVERVHKRSSLGKRMKVRTRAAQACRSTFDHFRLTMPFRQDRFFDTCGSQRALRRRLGGATSRSQKKHVSPKTLPGFRDMICPSNKTHTKPTEISQDFVTGD